MKTLSNKSGQTIPLCAIAVIIGGTFIVDLSTPRGVAAGVFPYYFAIFISSRLLSTRAPFVVAGIVTALTLIGFLVTTGGRTDIILFNRAFIVVTFWAMAALAHGWIIKDREIADQKAAVDRANQFRDLFDNSRLGIQLVNLDGRRVMVNKALVDLLRYESEAELRAIQRQGIIAPYDRDRAVSMRMIRAAKEDLPPSYEIDLLRKDGSVVPVQVFWRMLDWQGQATVQRTFIDISERKRAEAALLDSERRYRELFESAQLGIRISDAGGSRMTNQAMAAMLGYESLDEFQNLPRRSDIAPHDLNRIVTMEKIEAGEAPEIGSMEMDLVKKNGSILPVQVFWRTLEWEGVRAVQRTYIDISERREHERETQEREITVRELRRELAHASQVSAMGEISTVIAHELHQPLAAIATTAGAARRRLADEATLNLPMVLDEMLPLIADQADRAGNVISNIRTLFEGGMPSWSRESINAIVGETCELAATELHTTDIRYRRHFETSSPMVLVNKVQIHQVVYNLVRNAFEAVRDVADKEIEVAVSKTGSREVQISVRDSGIGLAPEISNKLFEPFTTSKKRGMGMGLFTCRTIVDSYGGRIWAESADDGGTIMRFTLPLEN